MGSFSHWLPITIVFAGSLLAQTPTPGEIAQRAALASGGVFDGLGTAAATTAEIEAALDLQAGAATSITTTGNAAQLLAPSALGVISPRAGSGFLLMSSGIAGTNAPERGTNYGGTIGPFGYDVATVTLNLQVPASATTLSFEYRLLSAEFPEYLTSTYDDRFVAQVNGSTVATASVNSSKFFPAFTSNAGGTGFDIFCPNPAGVDTVFPGGLPDAGLTDWQSAKADVTPGATISLLFAIGDYGDHILDTAIIIDNISFGLVEIIDGDDDQLRANGNDLANDPVVLSTGGSRRVGLCADGTSRLLLRANLPAAGSMAFTVQGFASTSVSGSLGAPGSTSSSSTIIANSTQTPAGHKAYAVFRAPVDFVRPGFAGDATARQRTITITTQYTPASGSPISGSVTVQIERPPVVLCHGLWSYPETWDGFQPLVGTNYLDITRVNYSKTHADLFSSNRLVVKANSTAARNDKKLRGIASAQVDWIGHSMGGLLPRAFIAAGSFRRPDNFGEGDIHKLITLNTPHWGSPWAQFLVGIRNSGLLGILAVLAMEAADMSIIRGAVDDLREGSEALSMIGSTNVPIHAVAGVGGSQAIGFANVTLEIAATLAPPPWDELFLTSRFFSFVTTATLYRNQPHDFVVLLASQLGGLTGSNTTTLNGIGSHHTHVTSHAPAATQCLALLNAPQSSNSFATSIPAPNLTPPYATSSTPGPQIAPPGQGISFPFSSDSLHEMFSPGTTFDLQNKSLSMTRNPQGYAVSCTTVAFVPPTANAIVVADGDDLEQTVALANAIPVAGGTANSITIDSNGVVTLSAIGNGSFSVPDAQILRNFLQPAIAVGWHDMDPTASGSGKIRFEQIGGLAYVTWDGVFDRATNTPNRFQLQINLSNGNLVLAYGNSQPTADLLVGYSAGGPSPIEPEIDLTTMPSFLVSDSSSSPPAIAAGGTVSLSASAFGGFSPIAVIFLGDGNANALDASPPFAATLTVPIQSIGSFKVLAIGIDAQDRVAYTNMLSIPVSLGATLTTVETTADRVYMSQAGETASMSVTGTFSDGVKRRIDFPEAGTSFLTSNAAVATVSTDGVITAMGEGTCAIVAQNGSIQVAIGVFVHYDADLSRIGTGCATSAGIPQLDGAGGQPKLGNATFRLEASHLPSNSIALFALQSGAPLDVGIPLPGAPACVAVYVVPQDIIMVPAAGGSASSALPIPSAPTLAGLSIGAQVAVWDPALYSMPLPIGSSSALRITIGH